MKYFVHRNKRIGQLAKTFFSQKTKNLKVFTVVFRRGCLLMKL